MRGSGEQVREGQSVLSITRASLGIPRDPGSNPGRAMCQHEKGDGVERTLVLLPGRAITKFKYRGFLRKPW